MNELPGLFAQRWERERANFKWPKKGANKKSTNAPAVVNPATAVEPPSSAPHPPVQQSFGSHPYPTPYAPHPPPGTFPYGINNTQPYGPVNPLVHNPTHYGQPLPSPAPPVYHQQHYAAAGQYHGGNWFPPPMPPGSLPPAHLPYQDVPYGTHHSEPHRGLHQTHFYPQVPTHSPPHLSTHRGDDSRER